MTVDFSPLLSYLNRMPRSEQIVFAKDCNTTIAYMRKRISLKRPFGFEISREIAARGIMTPQQLRPNDYENFAWERKV